MWRSGITAGALAIVATACTETNPVALPSAVSVALRSNAVAGTPTPEGPYERLDLATSGFAVDINNRGQVLLQTGSSSGAVVWYRGVSRDLGTLGGANIVASGMNASGQVTGASRAADGSWHQFLWTDGVMQDLGARNFPGIGGFPSVDPNPPESKSINNRGEVVWTVGPVGAQRAMLWRDGTALDLGTLGGPWSAAGAINNAGQVAGTSMVPGDSLPHFFLWENGVMRDLGRDSGDPISVDDINDSGQALFLVYKSVGCCRSARTLFWDGAEMRDISIGNQANGGALNSRGQVAMTGNISLGGDLGEPFIWDGSARRLSASNGWATALNEAGTIAGYSNRAFFFAKVTVWEGDSTWVLDSPQNSSQGSQPVAINDHGDVAGWRNGAATLWRRIHSIAIDIKPRSDQNRIQGGKSIPVAVLSTATFDATSVDPATVEFGGAPPANTSVEDVNRDGLPDVVYKFESSALVFAEGATQACLRAETLEGRAIKGCDAIKLKG